MMIKTATRLSVPRWIAPVLAVASGLLAGTTVGAQESEQDVIQRFSTVCRSEATADGKPFVEVRFVPVRPLDQDERPRRGTWAYTYDGKYPGDQYVLGTGGGQIHLVSHLHPPPKDAELPPYLWHVISVPVAPPNNNGIGFVARHSEFFHSESGVWNDPEYIRLQESRTANNILSYVNRRVSPPKIREITKIWRRTFGEIAMDNLVGRPPYESRIYTHTFIYQDTPKSAGKISQPVGDRRNSSRNVMEDGIAFGFVLDHGGRCLAATTLKISRKLSENSKNHTDYPHAAQREQSRSGF